MPIQEDENYFDGEIGTNYKEEIRRGRPNESKLDRYKNEIIELLENGKTNRFIAFIYRVDEGLLCKWIQKNVKTKKGGING